MYIFLLLQPNYNLHQPLNLSNHSNAKFGMLGCVHIGLHNLPCSTQHRKNNCRVFYSMPASV